MASGVTINTSTSTTPISSTTPTSSTATSSTSTPVIFLPSVNRRKRSVVWIHFQPCTNKLALCDICGAKVPTAGNTTNLMKHLQKKHMKEYEDVMEQQAVEKAVPKNKKKKKQIGNS